MLAIQLHPLVDDAKLEEYGAAEYDHADSIRILEGLDYRWRLPSFQDQCLLYNLQFFLRDKLAHILLLILEGGHILKFNSVTSSEMTPIEIRPLWVSPELKHEITHS